MPKIFSIQIANFKQTMDLILIFLGTILLGIWAVQGTIALRNILLILGALVSLAYCYRRFALFSQKILFKSLIPIVLLGLMFCWVFFHYSLLTRFPDIQLSELSSTWLRALLAAIMGFGIGMAIFQKPDLVSLFWLAILASFCYLLFQYFSLLWSHQNIVYWKYEDFIYPRKISSVLMGTILIAGVIGTFFDYLRMFSTRAKWMAFFCAGLGIIVPLYVYIVIIESLSGVGLALLIFVYTAIATLAHLSLHTLGKVNQPIKASSLYLLAGLLIISFSFSAVQLKTNSRWGSIMEDSKVAIQIDQYPNWQNPRFLGYPNSALGKPVAPNTYERISWAVVGATIFVPQNPLGIGVLSRPFGRLLNDQFPDSGQYINSSHSAWVEITLAFGIPGLVLLLGPLLMIAIRFSYLSIYSECTIPFKLLPAVLSFGITCLYLVGEVSSQHSIEILCFWIAFLSALYWLSFYQIKSLCHT
jgi:hypothetical protein